MNHFPTAITMRRQAHEMGAIFGGRLPMPPAFVAGGFTTKPTSAMISSFGSYLGALQQFINRSYVPDVQLLKSVYSDFGSVGRGPGNLLAYGVFDLNDSGSSKLLGRGLVYGSAPTTVQPVSTSNITEMVTNSWYADSTDNLNPASGKTTTVPAARSATGRASPPRPSRRRAARRCRATRSSRRPAGTLHPRIRTA